MNDNFKKLRNYLGKQNSILTVKNNDEFFHVTFDICGGMDRKQTQTIREMGFVIGDIQTLNTGNKYNPTKVLEVWFYPENSKHLE